MRLFGYGELIAELDETDNDDGKHGRHKEHVHGESPKLEVKIWRTSTGLKTEHGPDPTTAVVVPIKKVALVRASKLHVDCQTGVPAKNP